MNGKHALDLWDLIVAVLGNTNQSHKEQGDLLMNERKVRLPPHTIQKRKKIHGKIDDLNNVDFISSNVNSSRQEALLYVFEDNEAVIKMIIKGRNPTMRHVSRTHRVALDWLFDRINLNPKIQIKYIDTKNQLAGILTKGNFTRDEWNSLLHWRNRIIRWINWKQYVKRNTKMYCTFGYLNKLKTKTSVSRKKTIAQILERANHCFSTVRFLEVQDWCSTRPWIPHSTTR